MSSVDFDDLGDRQKWFENLANPKLIRKLPVMARLDGRAFHTFTKGFKRPFDPRLTLAMQTTMSSFMEPFGPTLGYTQSDEITLCWLPENNTFEKPFQFDGNVRKLTSLLAAHASVTFNEVLKGLPGFEGETFRALFDCRVWNVPDLETAADNFKWREMDATKNSVSMLASSLYSEKELNGKSTKQRIAMIEEKGQSWADLAPCYKRGSYVKRASVLKSLTKEELERIPEKYWPEGPVPRNENVFINYPPLTSIRNLKEVLFEDANMESEEGHETGNSFAALTETLEMMSGINA